MLEVTREIMIFLMSDFWSRLMYTKKKERKTALSNALLRRTSIIRFLGSSRIVALTRKSLSDLSFLEATIGTLGKMLLCESWNT